MKFIFVLDSFCLDSMDILFVNTGLGREKLCSPKWRKWQLCFDLWVACFFCDFNLYKMLIWLYLKHLYVWPKFLPNYYVSLRHYWYSKLCFCKRRFKCNDLFHEVSHCHSFQSLYASLIMRKDFGVQLNYLLMFESRYFFLFPQILLQVLPSCASDFTCEH